MTTPSISERLSGRRREEAAGWEALEALLEQASSGRPLRFEEVERMSALYRRAAAQLAEARAFGYAPRRRAYLEALVHRAHHAVYPAPRVGIRPVLALLTGGFARAFRQTAALQTFAIALFMVGAVVGYLATLARVELAYPLIGAMYPAEVIQSLIGSPQARADFLSTGQAAGAGLQTAFAAGLLANNTRVAFLVFSFGIAAGVPSVLIQTFNGALIGSFAALFAHEGEALAWWAWVLPHAVPEVLALCIATAGGLRMGLALIRPGPRLRRQALAHAGRGSAVLLGLAVLLLGYAALIEAYFRQTTLPAEPRLALAAINAVVIGAYLTLAGRNEPTRTDPRRPLA